MCLEAMLIRVRTNKGNIILLVVACETWEIWQSTKCGDAGED